MDFQDKNITCKDCSKEFVWTAGEQKFYADKGLQNPPGRCPDCRKASKENKANRPTYSIICKECGKEGQVPFQPRDPKDVLCAECFSKKKDAEKAPQATEDAPEVKEEETEEAPKE